jgi:hypothetical protein
MGTYHDFALLVDIKPENRLGDWEDALQKAQPEPGMSVQILKPTLLVFGVKADFELLALERAQNWLNGIASNVDNSISLAFNSQPADEVLAARFSLDDHIKGDDHDDAPKPMMPRL